MEVGEKVLVTRFDGSEEIGVVEPISPNTRDFFAFRFWRNGEYEIGYENPTAIKSIIIATEFVSREFNYRHRSW